MNFTIKQKSMNLDQIIEYSNDDVIYRFLKYYNIDENEAKDLFEETKKWLFACALNVELYNKKEMDFLLIINDDLLILDIMWHNFILFTVDYRDFCDKYLGMFINHTPARKIEELNNQNEKETNLENYQSKLKDLYKKQYSFIYDIFGKDTLIKWHKEWPEKYSIEEIKKLRN